jgi:hypothetical protein
METLFKFVEYDMILILSRGCVSDISLCSYTFMMELALFVSGILTKFLVPAVTLVEFRLF